MMKLPRGYGSIVKLSGKRENPFMVRVKDDEPIFDHEKGTVHHNYKVIGYAKTKREGQEMLHQYHFDPNFMKPRLTFKEIYYKMFDEYIHHLARTSHNSYNAAFDALEVLHDEIFEEIKMRELQKAFDNCGKNYPTLRKVKVLLNQMYKWAIKYDLVDKDYSRYIELSKHKNKNPNKRNTLVFTQEQIETMWKIKDTNEYYKVVLMLIYTGTRIQEMLTLKKENVNIEEQYFKVKESKTEAGIRKVPIADAIIPFFKHWMNNSDSEYLITTKDREQMLYSNYLNAYWKPILEPFGWKQTPHHARHTCVTLLTEARVEPTFIKLIVGHEGAMSLTERVYTHISNEPLLESVNKMFVPNI